MATVASTRTAPEDGNAEYYVVVWPDLHEGDTATPVRLAQFADRTVQIEGTFGGATVTFEGSVDESNFHVLTDPQGNPISATVGRLEAVTENTTVVKPVISGGSGTTITVTMLVKR